MSQTCSVDGCERGGRITRGMCDKHYKQLVRQGLPPLPSVILTCSVDGCGSDARSRGMCQLHYRRVMKFGSTDLPEASVLTCSLEGCDRADRIKRGLCNTHYERWRVHGTTDLLPVPTASERLAAGLERMSNGCLEWTGKINNKGYGKISVDGTVTLTHRFAWTLANGPIPDGMLVRHFVCDNPLCCDPEHLRLGTQTDNMADMVAKGRQNFWGWSHRRVGTAS